MGGGTTVEDRSRLAVPVPDSVDRYTFGGSWQRHQEEDIWQERAEITHLRVPWVNPSQFFRKTYSSS